MNVVIINVRTNKIGLSFKIIKKQKYKKPIHRRNNCSIYGVSVFVRLKLYRNFKLTVANTKATTVTPAPPVCPASTGTKLNITFQ